MPAPKNNTFWKNRSTHGRPKEFATAQEFHQAWIEYFDWVDKHPWYKTEQLKKPIVTKAKSGKEKIQSTIQIPTKRPYTEFGFCAFHGLGRHYLTELDKQLKDKPDEDYSYILSWARNICYSDKFEGAAIGAYNPSIIARDLGLQDLKKHEHSGPDGKPIETDTKVTVVKSTLKLT